MKLEKISYQYVPLHCKRRNAAERALRTFKNHFIGTLCTVDKDFPFSYGIVPHLTRAYQPGNKFMASSILRKATSARHVGPTWSRKFLLGASTRTLSLLITQRERIVDTVVWHPQNVMMPGASEKEILARVLTELRTAIQASTSNFPQPATALLITTLQDDLSALFFPITPPAVALSPIQQLIPQVQDLTRQLQTPPQPLTGARHTSGRWCGSEGGEPSHRTQRTEGGQPYPRRLRRYGLYDHNSIRYASCHRTHLPTPRRGQRYIRTNTRTFHNSSPCRGCAAKHHYSCREMARPACGATPRQSHSLLKAAIGATRRQGLSRYMDTLEYRTFVAC